MLTVDIILNHLTIYLGIKYFVIVQGVYVLGGICPGDKCLRVIYPRGMCPRECVTRGYMSLG